MKLAFADAERHVHDGPLPARYLDEEYLASRRALIDPRTPARRSRAPLQPSGTVYLCAVDEERNACSLIQSVFHGFGSLVVAPGHRRRPAEPRALLHARGRDIPTGSRPASARTTRSSRACCCATGRLLGPFGVMGGHMQPQGHLQVVSHMVDRGLDPQAALDEPRWRLDRDGRGGWSLALEEPLYGLAPALARRGHRAALRPHPESFGGGQAVLVRDDVLIGGSESRKDGVALGY